MRTSLVSILYSPDLLSLPWPERCASLKGGSLDLGVSRTRSETRSPGGTADNSPAFPTPGMFGKNGTASRRGRSNRERALSRPLRSMVQFACGSGAPPGHSFLRRLPASELAGYFQLSARDKRGACVWEDAEKS